MARFGITAATNSATATSVSVTGTAAADERIVVYGFDGSCKDKGFDVSLVIDGVTVIKMAGLSGTPVGRWLTESKGILTAIGGEAVVTTTPESSSECNSNIIFRRDL